MANAHQWPPAPRFLWSANTATVLMACAAADDLERAEGLHAHAGFPTLMKLSNGVVAQAPTLKVVKECRAAYLTHHTAWAGRPERLTGAAVPGGQAGEGARSLRRAGRQHHRPGRLVPALVGAGRHRLGGIHGRASPVLPAPLDSPVPGNRPTPRPGHSEGARMAGADSQGGRKREHRERRGVHSLRLPGCRAPRRAYPRQTGQRCSTDAPRRDPPSGLHPHTDGDHPGRDARISGVHGRIRTPGGSMYPLYPPFRGAGVGAGGRSVVGVKPETGFEPVTPCLQDRCSGHLSYSGGWG